MSNRGGTVISYPITGGMDRSASATASDPGTSLRTVMNARQDERGRWRKRLGYGGLTRDAYGGYNPSGGFQMIAEAGGSLVATTPGQVGVYDAVESKWVPRTDPVSGYTEVPPRWAMTGTAEIAGNNISNMEQPSVAIGGGLEVHVWRDAGVGSGDVMVAAYDTGTGGMVTPPFPIGTGTAYNCWARVVYGQSRFCIVYWDGSGNVRASIFTPDELRGRLTMYTALLGTDLSTTYKQVDVVATGYGGTERFFCAYPTATGLRVREIARSGTVISTPYTASYIGGAQRGVSITGSYGRDRVWAFGIDVATGLQVMTFVGLQSDNLATAAATNLYTLGYAGQSTGCCSAAVGGDTDAVWLCSWTYDAATHVLSGALYHGRVYYNVGVGYYAPMLVESVGPASQPIMDSDGRVVCWADLTVSSIPGGVYSTGYTFAPYSCAVLLELIHDSTVSTVSFGDAGNNSAARQVMLVAGQGRMFKHASQISGVTWSVAPKIAYQSSSVNYAAVFTVRGAGGSYTWETLGVLAARYRQMYGSGDRPVGERVGRQLVVSGGCSPYMWDGRGMTEIGFVFPPVIHSITLATTGGFIPASAAHQYAVVYEFTDAHGNLHQSAPVFSGVQTHGSGTSTNKATIVVNTLKLTTKILRDRSVQNVTIVLYRTTSGPGAVWYRLFGSSGVGVNKNDPQANTVTFVDTLADNGLDVATLYALPAGGELANEFPPPLVHAVPFNGRVAGIDATGAQDRIVFSKPIRSGRGIEWSSVLEQYVRGIGRLTGLSEMDGTLFAFGTEGVAIAAYGDGQDATGAGSWPQPQVISRTAFCSGPWAVARSSVGTIFAGRSGPPIISASPLVAAGRTQVWLLQRGGGEPVDIGAKLQPILDGTEPLRRFGEEIISFDPLEAYYPNVLSVVDWPEQSRAMVLLFGGAPVASVVCEYDYGSPGPDGIGAWSISTLGDETTTSALAQGVAFGGHWIGAYESGSTYLVVSNPASYADSLYSGDTNEPVYMYFETHGHQPDGQQPAGRCREVSLEYAVDETTQDPLMTLGLCVAGTEMEVVGNWNKDTFEPDSDTSPLTVTRANPYGRDATNGAGLRVAWGTGRITGEGAVDPPAESADMPPLSVSLEYISRPGAARARTTARR